jgi:transposase
VVDFDLFRGDLERAVPHSDRSKGGRPAFDHVLMFKVLVLQASHSLSDERTEYLIRDRLSFMRFLGLGLADTVPDANTIWTFREALTGARLRGKPAIEVLFKRFGAALSAADFLEMGGQIIDATIVAAPKQRNTDGEKREIKEGRIPAEWAKKPAKLRQKDRDARWTVKYTKAKPSADGAPRVDLAVPAFGYKNHVGIDRRYRLAAAGPRPMRRPERHGVGIHRAACHLTSMAPRDRWTSNLICPTCGRQGTAEISEADHPWISGPDRTIDSWSLGFVVIPGEANFTQQIVCEECKTVVYGPNN